VRIHLVVTLDSGGQVVVTGTDLTDADVSELFGVLAGAKAQDILREVAKHDLVIPVDSGGQFVVTDGQEPVCDCPRREIGGGASWFEHSHSCPCYIHQHSPGSVTLPHSVRHGLGAGSQENQVRCICGKMGWVSAV
jgi:hypothetical protein